MNFRCQRLIASVLTLSIFVLLPPPSQADDDSLVAPPEIKLGPWAHGLIVGAEMNAVGKLLRGSRFVGQDLRQAVFDGCDLDDVFFYQCDLSNASFKDACLTGATISQCSIKNADFTDAVINGLKLTDLYLSEKQLKSTHSYKTKNLSHCMICADDNSISIFRRRSEPQVPAKYNFNRANMNRAMLLSGDFSACDFSGAYIDGIEIYDSRITSKQLASTSNYKQRELRHMRFWNSLNIKGSSGELVGELRTFW